ncbi:sugar ABC transporter ATP-binding protein [Spirosoma endbachense]|uniref:ATP-binding cassette domain-containing protein n=1 Tax=Spirosoma endbachense TaxID=2666025 RepID=A0A6P1W1F7_9BACT|nr:sugar ABC transporter ATP-binding protein [Spirosoma endbachense]QHV97847.1 ATP-binding cassette domain-containing protein [Spirosoma endbachense]
MTPFLQLTAISKQFPGVKALDDVSFAVHSGEIHALCGENGAGKSTLMNILTGNLSPDSGELVLRNQPVQLSGPTEASRQGIAIVYQQLSLVDSLSVAENIFANRQPRNQWGLIRYKELYAATTSLLDRLKLPDLRPQMLVGNLSTGQKQMVEIAKALSQSPDLLLLDEPTASLTERETQTLFRLITQLRESGKAIVYISHRLNEIFALADRVSILKDGRYQGTLTISETNPTELIRRMVGRDVVVSRQPSTATNNAVLVLENVSGPGFSNVSFRLNRGEILGLAGLIGAGRTEVARAIFGASQTSSGTILLRGKTIRPAHPADAVELGIGYLPEERKSLGLFVEQTIIQNIITICSPRTKAGLFDASASQELTETYQKKLSIRTPSVREYVGKLSGGNQQKVMLARWLLTNPDVLLVDEPTHGMDVGAKAEVYAMLRQLAAEGKAILLISSELPELMALSDRILVMREGQLTGEVSGDKATEEQLMALATH